MNTIPIDLNLEIFSRLPAKSVRMCRCVSVLWRSILCRQDFAELFLARSLTRPRILFAMKEVENGVWSIFSTPQPHYPYEKSSSSLVVAADFLMKLPENLGIDVRCDHASGLLCFSHFPGEKVDKVHVICNPSTGECTSLPKLIAHGSSNSFLGFDPIDKQFKFLVVHPYRDDHHKILTLGTEKMSWRKIQCPLSLSNKHLFGGPICFNGVLYFSAQDDDELSDSMIVCFDVRSETFRFLDVGFTYECAQSDYSAMLINYKGRLGMIIRRWPPRRPSVELCVWVLEDAEKQQWSKSSYTLLHNEIVGRPISVYVSGVTATGEIVLSDYYTCKEQFCVFYFNPERNTLQTLEIQGNHQAFHVYQHRVDTFVDHVEDLKFHFTKTTFAATSISPPPEQKLSL